MWVYIGTSELKNAYIGEVYEYSYDFRNKTTTQLANDWWTNTSWLTTGANWVTASSWTAIFNQISWLWDIMGRARKLKLELLMYDNWSSSTWSTAWVTLVTWTDGYTQTWFYTDNSNVWAICGSWTETIKKSQTVYNTKWDYTLTAEYDFVNKILSVNFPSVYSWTATLADSNITVAKTNNTVRCPIQTDRYIKTIYVLVE